MPVSTFIARRLVYGVIVVLMVVILNFFLIHMAPGDPAEVIAGEMGGVSEEFLAEIRHQYGLDKPLLEQLYIYITSIMKGDFGFSFYYNIPVIDLIKLKLLPTLLLVITSLICSMFIGTVLGVLASLRPQGTLSALVTLVALMGYALPVFWTGIMLVILFASMIPIFPVEGMRDVLVDGNIFVVFLDILHHLFLPALTLTIIFMAFYARLGRASMLEVLGSDYIRTARSKGLSELRVIYFHALRNAILPIITIAGLHFANLLSGALLVETVFNWPGLGRLAFDSLLRRDYPTILAILIMSAAMVVVANLIIDFIYRFADPRIRYK